MNLVCPRCYEDHPCSCERREEEEKTWESYRFEEMEEKAGVVSSPDNYPERDMDGSHFIPYITPEEETAMEDAYYMSISKRLHIRSCNC